MAVVRALGVDLVFKRRLPFSRVHFRFVTMVEKRRGATVDPAAAGRQTSFGRHGGQRDKRIKENRTARQNRRTNLPVDL